MLQWRQQSQDLHIHSERKLDCTGKRAISSKALFGLPVTMGSPFFCGLQLCWIKISSTEVTDHYHITLSLAARKGQVLAVSRPCERIHLTAGKFCERDRRASG